MLMPIFLPPPTIRLWRWSVWRRLYHSSVVTDLKQQRRSPSETVNWTRRKARLGKFVSESNSHHHDIRHVCCTESLSSSIKPNPASHACVHLYRSIPSLFKTDSTYIEPTPFQYSVPDAGTVTVASTGSFNSIHLVTRAASPEQKSLVYVNGTEVSGHLRSAIHLPSPLSLDAIGKDKEGLLYECTSYLY